MSIFDEASPIGGFPVLEKLAWELDPDGAQATALDLLKNEEELLNRLSKWLSAFSDDDLEQVTSRSSEKLTHQKWFLGGGAGRTYTVSLHEYSSPENFSATDKFAASVHNHRYGFASIVLSGGLQAIEFQPQDNGEFVNLQQVGERWLRTGQTMSLAPDDVHKINAVEPNTFTLLIQGPAQRHYSTCYLRDGRTKQIPDHQEMFSPMRAKLHQLAKI